ncbi:hypothetical protein LWI28_001065 [Acer negundo]|uniref:Ribosome biogenesis protein NOP53 n=1 Tax=Acer negundo TaxID=4023 RepID=A0AAD5I834_ACENE|nr:hypothetical protein LWI28_001065 [Acer negundo]
MVRMSRGSNHDIWMADISAECAVEEPLCSSSASSKSKLKKSIKKQKDVLKENDATLDCPKDDSVIASGMIDIWANEGDNKSKKVSKPSVIPAVEVEAPGCSFNPAYESHQESLAQAVAEEMQKVYQNELGPEPILFTVPGHAIDDEDRYFLEVDNASDDEGNVENLSENAHENRSIKTKRVTRVELNKRARLKDLQTKNEKAKKVEEVSKQIDCLPDIIQEIAKEDEENKKRHMRRLVAKQERLKVRPPRLGRHKFEPAPTQVLLSEEINGSLRKLKDESVIATGILDIWANDEGEGGNKAKKLSKKTEGIRPQRLGRHKFEPAPTQFLLSEEINGSLRKLKGCSSYAKGRFKSPEMKMVDKSPHSKKLALINFLSVAFKLKDIYADGDGG